MSVTYTTRCDSCKMQADFGKREHGSLEDEMRDAGWHVFTTSPVHDGELTLCADCAVRQGKLSGWHRCDCETCWAYHLNPSDIGINDIRRLLGQAHALHPGTAPWRVDLGENVGENWVIAFMGEDYDGRSHIVTTAQVNGSDTSGDPKADAEFIVWCRNNIGKLLRWVEQEVGGPF